MSGGGVIGGRLGVVGPGGLWALGLWALGVCGPGGLWPWVGPARVGGLGEPGGDLLFRRLETAVPSALRVFTAEFGMGSGVWPLAVATRLSKPPLPEVSEP